MVSLQNSRYLGSLKGSAIGFLIDCISFAAYHGLGKDFVVVGKHILKTIVSSVEFRFIPRVTGKLAACLGRSFHIFERAPVAMPAVTRDGRSVAAACRWAGPAGLHPAAGPDPALRAGPPRGNSE